VTSDQGNGNTITGLLLAHQIVQLCLTAIYFYEFFVFQGVISWFRVVVCDWSRCGVLLRRAGYDIKAPWGNTKLKVQNCGVRKRSRGTGGRLRKRNEDKGGEDQRNSKQER